VLLPDDTGGHAHGPAITSHRRKGQPNMAGRIVLFGATGYMGELTARALAGRGERPVLAARNAQRLEALAAQLGGLDTAVADVGRPDTVRALVERGDVLVSTVGPFERHGEPAVQAAIAAGAHYLDSTGEGPFIREVFQRHGPGARAAGCALLTAFGYDFVPGNLAGALALRDAGGAATRIDIAYFTPGRFAVSGGTRASAAGVILEPGFAWRDGRIVAERQAARVRSFRVRSSDKPAVSISSSEHFALPRLHSGLREVGVYLGTFGAASRPMHVLSAVNSMLMRIPGARSATRAAVTRFVKGSTGGPDADARKKSGSYVVAAAYDGTGNELSEARLTGVNVYDFTAGMLSWGAQRAAAGALQDTGALGPVDGFGLDALQTGAAEAGLARE
jgi:short subunit dehydrogenase-like uncharacterized protein